MNTQFNCLSDCAVSLKLITWYLCFLVIKNGKSPLSKKMDNIGLHAFIKECEFELVTTCPFHLF